MFLITGMPRSGTMYIAKVLSVFKRVAHERMLENADGIVSFAHIADGYCENIGIKNVKKYDYDIILHQVRHPLNNIGSFINERPTNDTIYDYMFKHIGTPDKKSSLYYGMYCWYHWNKLVEKNATWRYRIENLHNEYKTLYEYLDIDTNNVLPKVSKYTNHRTVYNKPTWETLINEDEKLGNQIKDLAKEYGYV